MQNNVKKISLMMTFLISSQTYTAQQTYVAQSDAGKIIEIFKNSCDNSFNDLQKIRTKSKHIIFPGKDELNRSSNYKISRNQCIISSITTLLTSQKDTLSNSVKISSFKDIFTEIANPLLLEIDILLKSCALSTKLYSNHLEELNKQ